MRLGSEAGMVPGSGAGMEPGKEAGRDLGTRPPLIVLCTMPHVPFIDSTLHHTTCRGFHISYGRLKRALWTKVPPSY